MEEKKRELWPKPRWLDAWSAMEQWWIYSTVVGFVGHNAFAREKRSYQSDPYTTIVPAMRP